MGDCPFTQRANLALKLKGIKNVTIILIDLANKPEWYKGINAVGSVPTLEFNDKVITDSYEIVKYLDEAYPDPPLEPCNNKEAEEVTGMILTHVLIPYQVTICHTHIWTLMYFHYKIYVVDNMHIVARDCCSLESDDI